MTKTYRVDFWNEGEDAPYTSETYGTLAQAQAVCIDFNLSHEDGFAVVNEIA